MTGIHGIARFKFHDGKVEDFKRLAAQAMDIVRANCPGTIRYDIYFNEDESEAMFIEHYADVQAFDAHVEQLGDDLIGEAFATASVTGEMWGELGPELTARLADGPFRVFTPFLSID